MRMKKFRLRKKNLSQKQINNKRRCLAFFLFICFVVFSICCCLKISVLNTSHIVSASIDSTYINALQDDIYQYASDCCIEAGIPFDAIDETITYENIYNIENSYISSLLNASQQFNSQAFSENIQALKQELALSTQEMLVSNGIEITDEIKNNIDVFATDVADYAQSRFVYTAGENIVTIVNIANKALTIIIPVLAIIMVLAVVSLTMTGNTKYRNLRYVAYSLTAATFFDFVIVGVIFVASYVRPPALQPSYLAQALTNYIDQSIYDLSMTALGLLCGALFVLTMTWRLKRNQNG